MLYVLLSSALKLQTAVYTRYMIVMSAFNILFFFFEEIRKLLYSSGIYIELCSEKSPFHEGNKR